MALRDLKGLRVLKDRLVAIKVLKDLKAHKAPKEAKDHKDPKVRREPKGLRVFKA